MDTLREPVVEETTLIQHRIGGAASSERPERVGDVYDPASGRITKQVAFASPETVDRAVGVAKKAFPAWRDLPLARRTRVMFAFRELLQKRKEELARVI